MRWIPGGRSRNLEDRRGASPGGLGGGGFGGGGAKLGVGGMLILAVLSMVFGRDLVSEYGGGGAARRFGGAQTRQGRRTGRSRIRRKRTWCCSSPACWIARRPRGTGLMPQYTDAKLVLFRDAVNSACGFARGRERPVLLPGRPEGLHRPRVLRPARAAVRRAGRLRAGVRARARDRPPRAEPHGHRARASRGAAAQSRAGQRAVGRHGAAGRLLCRRVGELRREGRLPRGR